MFDRLRPLIRIARALEEIAGSLSYFALKDAQTSGRMFIPPSQRKRYSGDQSELIPFDPATVARLKAEEQAIISNRGFAYLDEMESRDE